MKYRIVECRKGVYHWFEIEIHRPIFWNKDRWTKMRMVSNHKITTATFMTKQEAISYADQELAEITRKVVEIK